MNRWDKSLKKYFRKKGYKKEYLKLRVAEHKKSLIQTLCILALSLIFLSVLFYTPYSKIFIKDKIISLYFVGISNMYESDNIVISIAEVCSHLEEEEKQIRCVNNFVNEFFYYDEHEKKVKLPLEIINNGGCCRDYSVFYKSIFSLMNYESEFIHEPTHVYLKVFGNESNYIIDQEYLKIEEKNVS